MSFNLRGSRDEQQGSTVQHRELYIQYLIIYNGKESEKEYIYIYITESLCCTPEANTNIANQFYFK